MSVLQIICIAIIVLVASSIVLATSNFGESNSTMAYEIYTISDPSTKLPDDRGLGSLSPLVQPAHTTVPEPKKTLSFQDNLLLIYTIATVVQVFVVAITLIFIYIQTRAANLNIKEIQKATRIKAYITHRENLTHLNYMLFTHDDLRKAINYKREDILAFVLLGYAELVFLQNKFGVIDKMIWPAHNATARKFVSFSFVQNIWRRFKQEYSDEFIEYVDNFNKDNSEGGNAPSSEIDSSD